MPTTMKSVRLDPRRFQIGDWVSVDAVTEIERTSDGDRRAVTVMVKENHRGIGRIVGVTAQYEGTVDTDYEGGEFGPGQPIGNFLNASCRTEFWLVRFGLMNRPVLVRDEHAHLCGATRNYKLPILYTKQPEWDEAARKRASTDSKHYPRDKQGRWART